MNDTPTAITDDAAIEDGFVATLLDRIGAAVLVLGRAEAPNGACVAGERGGWVAPSAAQAYGNMAILVAGFR